MKTNPFAHHETALQLRALRSKAGLPRDHWSRDLAFERYTVESFS